MSFGFGVGDIILLSQLSYKLYGTLTSGRRNASRELKELEHVLFGLRCALDHLRHVAEDISKAASISGSSDSHGREMQQSLDQMIQNCAMTLEDLDNATKRYRDNAMIYDNERDSDSGRGVQKRRRQLRDAVTSNWAKIRWDMDKDSLKTYRDRLQSHVDNINMVLGAFHW
ncbi:uncharacterized protein Z520_00784 [Fonsecaea multimorphosa CBS 102226]|uniref:Fungal N-terminal domain-containing protein n=1 Tax=Fonsecaea multimorphosa CBS 102226 TaxID=1442371 RepID=A0A0D2J3W1_9EURO|nr:uncharacterized protein Z520_00784 [Fonsecaea multimorphosa CBS 102226]KIY04092.1 hypothetical protein Z520_00784 [Fonsecaea multimorphosa CBS 102226]OAL31925.1 hypothetical protein AYO22_00795 [Fonsecaea multimorphosa]